jgi:hypothetical protein
VRAKNSDGSIATLWTNVAVFLSEGTNDGYVQKNAMVYTPFPTANQPGIRAGQGMGTDLKGFLSFDTSVLGSSATILSAKIRLKQTTDNSAFTSLGTCMVDSKKGGFNGSLMLEGGTGGGDYTALADATNVSQVPFVSAGNWTIAELNPNDAKIDISNTDHTQFRLYFNHVMGVSNKTAGWNSGESIGNEPQLIVQYTQP